MDSNTVAIWTTAPLPYLLITKKVIALEKVLSVIYEIVRLFLNTLIVDDKQYPHKRDNLTQQINMQLSQKQKTFS